MNQKSKGIIYILCSSACFATMALFIKLAGNLPSMQKVLFRNGLIFLLILSIMLIKKEKIEVKKEALKPLMMRCLFGCVGIIGNFYAVDHMALADASMLNKLNPFVAIFASYFILKEKFNKVQIIAMIGAFIGALFIIKPTGDVMNIAAIAALLGACGGGIAYTFVRKLGTLGVKGNIVILCFSGFTSLLCLPFVVAQHSAMSGYQWLMMLGVGVCATGGQLFVTKAYMCAPAKEISVFDYSQILFSAVLGIVFLQQIPDAYSIIGYIIICSMGIAMFLYNNRKVS